MPQVEPTPPEAPPAGPPPAAASAAPAAGEPVAADDAAAAPGGLGGALYKLALAGVGALVLAQEEVEATWQRWVGEPVPGEEPPAGAAPATPAEGDGSPAAAEQGGARGGLQVDAAIGRMLEGLSVPTRDDLDAAARRLDELAARVEALLEARRRGA